MSLIIALGILLLPLAAEAQQAGRVYRIGYMSVPSRQSAEHLLPIFLEALREPGWVEGQNLLIEWRWAEGKLERLPDFAAELVRLNVDLIVAPQPASALAAKNATRTIPIVFMFPADPVADGLVASLARPGGNVTGTTGTPTLDIYGKQLELLKETVPKASRVAVLSNPARAAVQAPMLREVERAARSLGLELQVPGVQGPEDFDRAFEAMTRERANALFVLPDSLLFSHRQRLADLEAKHRLPTMHNVREFVESGALMAYGVDLAWHLRRAAFYIDRILKGANPANLPVEQPTKFELVINLKTAKALGLTLPQSLLIRADQVIQ
jgi:putative ABC transport system substrate-binding protein